MAAFLQASHSHNPPTPSHHLSTLRSNTQQGASWYPQCACGIWGMGTGYIHHKQRLWKRDHLTWEAGHKVELCTMFWGCADTIIEPREAGIRLPVHPRANISLSYICACELEISLWINCQCRSSSRLGEKENANPQECACVLQRVQGWLC